MILEIRHETQLAYSDPVIESVTEVRMEPISDDHQSVRSFQLKIDPFVEVYRYLDGFGNRVHHFNVLRSTGVIRVIAASVVETHPQPRHLEGERSTYPLTEEHLSLAALPFLGLRGPTRYTPRLQPLLDTLQPAAGMPIDELMTAVAGYICSHFEYATDVTLASSPIDDTLTVNKGVCQDFAHLMIAIMRSYGVPTRYVSGYIHRPDKDSQSHAWCEVWLPESGWCGIDPTNNQVVNDHFVKVAVGRDFTDVSPNKGVYRGRASEEISVRVESRSLSRLPSVSWQDTAPAFKVPLTSVASRMCMQEVGFDSSQQQ
jgi:transglutaminase-like putative cysteine protease